MVGQETNHMMLPQAANDVLRNDVAKQMMCGKPQLWKADALES